MEELLSEFWADFTNPKNLLGHVAYILLITSMMMRNMNLLRLFALASGMVAAFYYYQLGDRVSMVWETIFVVANFIQYCILFLENKGISFTKDEQLFIRSAVPNLDRAQLRRLINLAALTQVHEGNVLIKEDTCPTVLIYVIRGEAKVERKSRIIGKVCAGDFLGEMSYLTSNTASATVTTLETMDYFAFDRARLTTHLDRNPEVKHAMEASFNRNLISKLNLSNEASMS